MPTYRMSAPDGNTYQIDGPAGATDDQVRAEILRQHPEAGTPRTTKPAQRQAAPVKQPTLLGQLWEGTKNAAAGIGQNLTAIPDLATEAIGKTISTVPTVAGYAAEATGHPAIGKTLHDVARSWAYPVTLGGLIEQAAPTPQTTSGKAVRLIAQVASPVGVKAANSIVDAAVNRIAGVVPRGFVPATTQGQRTYQAAKRLNMQDQLLPADVGGTGTRMATSASAMTLGGIPIAEQATKGINALARARNATAEAAGSVRDVTGAGQAAQTGAKNFIANTEKRATQLYDAIPIAGETPATLSNTKDALAQLNQGLQSNPELSQIISDPRMKAYEAAIAGRTEQVPTGVLDASGNPITKAVQKGGQLSWQDLKAFRTYVGEKAGAPALQSDTPQKALKSLYGALSEDMGATAAQQGPAAQRAFNRANTFWRGRQDRIDNVISTVLGNDLNKNPNAAFEGVQRMSQTIGGDPIKLGRLMRSLSPDEANTVRATVIHRMGQARPGAQDVAGEVFSPSEFVTQWNKMDGRSKAVLFNNPQVRSAINDIAEVAGGMKAGTKYANTSKTALGVNGSALLLAALAHPILTAGAAGAEFGIGSILSSPKLARILADVGKSNTQGALRANIARLSAIAANDAGLRPQALALQGALNDNLSAISTSAASPAGADTNSYQQ